MSFSATRLTCFALLSAMEEDMRAAIESAAGHLPIEQVLPADLADLAQNRRLKDGLTTTTSVAGLLAYLDFGDSYEVLRRHAGIIPTDLRNATTEIASHVQRVIKIRNRVAHTRPMEIDDSSHLLDVASVLRDAAGGHWPGVSDTLAHLDANPSYVLGLTIKLRADPIAEPQHNLPIPDFDETGFFGRKDQLTRIKRAIKGAYPVVSILGDGGIGKTSVALKVAYELLEDPTQPFEAIVWVTAKATILTTSEIQRISGAIESSVGLFAQAASQLAGTATDDPIAEVLTYLENFKILLILDNLETVLDARLREFLLDLPLGSKVLVTSRIGLGIENPVQLGALELDEAARLLRALARIRNIPQVAQLDQATIENLVDQMGRHPAYIRWFVAGVQAGRRPEELLGNNTLLLDYCMSNVYDYLDERARAVLRCMQALPGAKNQAELAFLNDFPAEQIQRALLDLLTTNFVHMKSQISGTAFDTVYELSEFGRQYLDKTHPVDRDSREAQVARSRELLELGSRLAAAGSASPYSADAVKIRGAGDIHVARLLRDAMRVAATDTNAALDQCVEAQLLSPSYFEAWRIEGHVRSTMNDVGAADAAYERALELAPDSTTVRYHYGVFLVDQPSDLQRGLEILQSAAKLDPDSPEIAGQIAWAHFCLGNYVAALDVCEQILRLGRSGPQMRSGAAAVAMRAAGFGIGHATQIRAYDEAVDLLEQAVAFGEVADPEALAGEPFDRLLALNNHADHLAQQSDDYAARKAKSCGGRLQVLRAKSGEANLSRVVGTLRRVRTDKGFGFVRVGTVDYFFHYRDLVDSYDWERLSEHVDCALLPVPDSPRGPRAQQVRVLY